MARLVALLLLALAALAPSAAWAHAALVQSDPADGQVLAAAPTMAHLRFNEPVSPLVFRLFDASGRIHRDLGVTRHERMIMVTLPAGLGTGSHVLSWRVTSTDGHPIGGSLTFSVGQASAARSAPAEDVETGPRWPLWLSRLILYCGLFLGVGGAFFRSWFTPGAQEQRSVILVRALLIAGLLAAPVSLALQGLDALGSPLSDIAVAPTWRAGFATTLGYTVIAAVLSLASAFASLVLREQLWRRVLSLAALVGVGIALSLSGHASSAQPQWLTRSAVLIHGVAVAYWIGALLPLALLLRGRSGSLPEVVRAWSTGAVAAVTALVLTGTALAWIQVQSPGALVGTAYGRILYAKLALVVALLGLAAMNRFRLTPALGQADRRAERRLSASAGAELVLALVILGLVGLWRFTPPPRALETPPASRSEAVVAHLHTPQAMAEVTLVSGHTGPARARIVLVGSSGPLDPKEVTLSLSNGSAGVEAIARPAARVGPGEWEVRDLVLPVPGRWDVRVEVLVSDFEKAVLEGGLEVRP
ncbi:CopD family protein [Microvirga massiliensis]|uniref:copper resistance CopC/CopD family protein n=1 Tax=Microvirga massiliensis TaxID=1033741 RepID=UPI00062B37BB|nr:CopD family protein [Microvirga massiliensis]